MSVSIVTFVVNLSFSLLYIICEVTKINPIYECKNHRKTTSRGWKRQEYSKTNRKDEESLEDQEEDRSAIRNGSKGLMPEEEKEDDNECKGKLRNQFFFTEIGLVY